MSTKFSVNESFVPLFELNADFGLNIQETFAFERPRKSLSLCLLRRQRRKRQQMHEAWNPFAACSHSAPLPSTLLMTDIRQFLPKNNQSISFQWLCSADDNTRGTWSPPQWTRQRDCLSQQTNEIVLWDSDHRQAHSSLVVPLSAYLSLPLRWRSLRPKPNPFKTHR